MSRKAVLPGRKALPRAFTYTEAQAAGISAERLYADRAQGLVDQIARGLYRWADVPEIDQVPLENRPERAAGHALPWRRNPPGESYHSTIEGFLGFISV